MLLQIFTLFSIRNFLHESHIDHTNSHPLLRVCDNLTIHANTVPVHRFTTIRHTISTFRTGIVSACLKTSVLTAGHLRQLQQESHKTILTIKMVFRFFLIKEYHHYFDDELNTRLPAFRNQEYAA